MKAYILFNNKVNKIFVTEIKQLVQADFDDFDYDEKLMILKEMLIFWKTLYKY